MDVPPDVLVRPGWPRGFCPVHCLEFYPCGAWCIPVRQGFARAARDLERYFLVEYGRHDRTHQSKKAAA